MSKPKQILSDKFFGGGRGPGLIKIFWDDETNTKIEKIIFEGNSVLKFTGLQTVMITPHEVYGGEFLDEDGIYDMGHSDWFRSMSSGHLDKCNHYRLFFYDEIIDVICEDIVIKTPWKIN